MLAATDGYKKTKYNHTVYLFPPRETMGCGVTGVGEVGGDTAWLFGLSASSFTHEVGHNLGLFHSGRRDRTGIAGQYGDLSSPMGAFQPEAVLFSAPHQSQLGWLPTAAQESVRPGTVARRTIYALERVHDLTSPTVITIPLADETSYKLSYRQELPEAPSTRSRSYVQGLTIHRDAGLGLTTKLFTVLHDGESFIDEKRNIRITQLSHTADTVTFDLAGTVPLTAAKRGCYVMDPCTVTAEGRAPKVMDCRGFAAPVSYYDFSPSGRCPARTPGEDYDLDGVADTEVQTADADGDGVPNEEDCSPTSAEAYRFYGATDTDGDGAYESLLSPAQGVCGALTNPPGYVAESRLDSCVNVSDPAQTDNDRDGIGDVCQLEDPLAASRRRMLPALQQLARAAAELRTLPAARGAAYRQTTSTAIKRFLVSSGSEPALAAAAKSEFSKIAARLARNGQARAGAKALSTLLASFDLPTPN